MTSTATVMPASYAAPVQQSERIVIIDALRGFAILGILLMNIPGFGLPPVDPYTTNEQGTINFTLWYIVDWLPEGTQRGIFSMLFGAGILLFIERQEKKLSGLLPADYFYRRQLWLLVFGLFDIYVLLWWGDILFDYACYGMIMFVFRKLPPKKLLIGAGICFLLMTARENRDFYQDKAVISKGEKVAALDTTKVKLTEKQKDQLEAMKGFKENATKEKKLKRKELSIRSTIGSYYELYEYRTKRYIDMLVNYGYLAIWDVLLFMFIGMAFYKMGILTGQAPMRLYWIFAIVGLGVGLVVSYYRLQPLIKYKFNYYDYVKNTWFEYYTFSRALRTLGVFGTLMLMYKSGWFKWLFTMMRPVGQMAFTNYLTQSILSGIFFYGVGFAMYGKVQRVEAYYFVGAVWVLQIIWSNIWLRYFQFGPLEWCWRSLTYWKRQPMLKSKSNLPPVE